MAEKKFCASIYLYQGKAVKNRRDRAVISEEPEKLAVHYCDNYADEIIIFDLSETDAEHEESLLIMKKIASASEVPVIGCGNVKRFEDIKKILYTGCSRAALNYSKDANVELTEEVSKRFGKEKIAVCVKKADEVKNAEDRIREFASLVICVNAADEYDTDQVQSVVAASPTEVLLPMPDAVPGKLAEVLSKDGINGFFGPHINASIDSLMGIKSFCAEQGVTVNGFDAKLKFSDLKTDKDGLIPVVVQEYRTNQVLMVAYMNEEAFESTIKTGRMTYYSRSRQSQWVKGETSGHFQYVKSLSADCDKDTLLAKVSQVGVACHTGSYSCFFNEIVKKEYINRDPHKVLEDVYGVIADRKANPKEGSYTNYLFDKGIDKILKKVGEEATEIIIAAKNPEKEEVKYEISDFLYHCMVLMVEKGVTWDEIMSDLASR
ncbi:MAG: bifunctional phosphoribosyl-AMP cyclohydrolase/phosphoribosyl-ATP diphosphatase HisIE [Lachnospiraceae bacterium]|nr:bifunctional phosphoribosyl-AMP cyclohydrolase/phosphoribosyl-ATP diphosphatase HisIE [Lachnospiraceae bacterium]